VRINHKGFLYYSCGSTHPIDPASCDQICAHCECVGVRAWRPGPFGVGIIWGKWIYFFYCKGRKKGAGMPKSTELEKVPKSKWSVGRHRSRMPE
jgi:hypothetical protein